MSGSGRMISPPAGVFDGPRTPALSCWRAARETGMRVSVGEFVLDLGTRQLLRASEPRHLGPKALELLELLLRQRPNVVARERIRDRLWPVTHVTDSTLATVVAEVRAALDEDTRQPRFLRTVHGVGYAFCGEASQSGESAAAPPAHAMAFRLLLEDREVALRPRGKPARPRGGRRRLDRGADRIAASRAHPGRARPRGDRGPRKQERHLRAPAAVRRPRGSPRAT